MIKNEILLKLSKAVDAFTDVLTEDVDSKKHTAIYKYEDFVCFVKENLKTNLNVKKCTIAIEQVSEFDGVIYPETKFLIRIVLLDKDNLPIAINANKEEYLGSITIANCIDTKLKNFMGERKEKTVAWKGDS